MEDIVALIDARDERRASGLAEHPGLRKYGAN
jgi:hypothetical protein